MRFQRKEFKKSDLKPGMVVLRRDGRLCIVNEDCSRIVRKKGYLNLYKIGNDLRYSLNYNDKYEEDEFDIMKVYSTIQKNRIIDNRALLNDIDKDLLNLIWERWNLIIENINLD